MKSICLCVLLVVVFSLCFPAAASLFSSLWTKVFYILTLECLIYMLAIWSMKFTQIILENVVAVTQETHCTISRNLNSLMLFRKIIYVYSEDHSEPIDTLWMLNHVVHSITTVVPRSALSLSPMWRPASCVSQLVCVWGLAASHLSSKSVISERMVEPWTELT
jgi:hypothetical protein